MSNKENQTFNSLMDGAIYYLLHEDEIKKICEKVRKENPGMSLLESASYYILNREKYENDTEYEQTRRK